MANVRTPVLSGITEFGEITGGTGYSGGTDVPWGATERNGVTIAIAGEDVDVQSGQNLVLEASFASARTIEITGRLQYSGLMNLRDALGMPAGALSGDIQNGTPTDEVLAIVGTNMGSESKHMYALTPGPVSTRKYQAINCKQRAGMTLELGSAAYVMLETTWTVLDGGAYSEMEILDSAT
jgi:hypothetical protein